MNIRISTLFLYICFCIACLTGCSKAEINRQVAESIGTLGIYENDEPVETPKMRADKEMQEAKTAVEAEVSLHLASAEQYAIHYDYEQAIKELEMISEEHQDDERVVNAMIDYKKQQKKMTHYGGVIPHFSVERLVVDPDRAYHDPEMGSYYNNWTLTTGEFRRALQELYDHDYILMNINDLITVSDSKDAKKKKSLLWNTPLVPEGKKPCIISVTESDYNVDENELGFPSRLVTGSGGEIEAEYLDASGKALRGAYDAIPILNEFVEKHPDFSLRGARGIVAIEGFRGIFGYDTETEGETIRQIADTLKEQGWLMACQGYTGLSMESSFDNNEYVQDMENWSRKTAPLVGDTNLLFFPYGEEFPWGGYKHAWSLEHGYTFFFNIWATKEYLYVYDEYVVQSRRPLNGYVLHTYPEDMKEFFEEGAILDSNRPSF